MAKQYTTLYIRTKSISVLTSETLNSKIEVLNLTKQHELEDTKMFKILKPSLIKSTQEILKDDLPAEIRLKGKICESASYLGIRLTDLLYRDLKLRKGLGLYIREDIPDKEKLVTKRFSRNFNAAAGLGVVNSVYVTFEATNPGSIYVPWGTKHRTYIVFDASKELTALSNFLYGYTFLIGDKKVEYKIQDDSIQKRRSKKSKKRFE